MLKAERQQKIIEQIQKDDKVVADDLGGLLKVSTDTIRRDIKELSDKGLLKAVRGGAILNAPVHLHFNERKYIGTRQKKIIATKALGFIKPGQVILMNAGTTTTAVAEALLKNIPLTVITNSFPVVSVLEDFPEVNVIFLGGQLNKHGFSTTGFETIDAIRNFPGRYLSAGYYQYRYKNWGITGFDYQESLVDRAMIETSKYTIALSTYDKIGAADPYYICAINAIDVLITEENVASPELLAFKAAGITIR